MLVLYGAAILSTAHDKIDIALYLILISINFRLKLNSPLSDLLFGKKISFFSLVSFDEGLTKIKMIEKSRVCKIEVLAEFFQ